MGSNILWFDQYFSNGLKPPTRKPWSQIVSFFGVAYPFLSSSGDVVESVASRKVVVHCPTKFRLVPLLLPKQKDQGFSLSHQPLPPKKCNCSPDERFITKKCPCLLIYPCPIQVCGDYLLTPVLNTALVLISIKISTVGFVTVLVVNLFLRYFRHIRTSCNWIRLIHQFEED